MLTPFYLVCRYYLTNMSNSSANAILATIPHLSRPNYSIWAPMMEAYLSSQGQWRILFRAAPQLEYPMHTISCGCHFFVSKP